MSPTAELLLNYIYSTSSYPYSWSLGVIVPVPKTHQCYVNILESDCFGAVHPVAHFLGISDLSIANVESIYVKVCDILLRKRNRHC